MKQSVIYEYINQFVESLNSECHAVFEHEYVSDENLKTRIKAESVSGASCFYDGCDVIELISDIVYDSTDIVIWLKNDEIREDLRIVADIPSCGKKYMRKNHVWSDGAIQCDHVIVLLRKIYDKYGCLDKVVLLTAYPI